MPFFLLAPLLRQRTRPNPLGSKICCPISGPDTLQALPRLLFFPLTRGAIRPISGRPASFRIVFATVPVIASLGAAAAQGADSIQRRSAHLQSRDPSVALVRIRRLRASLRCHLGDKRAQGVNRTPRRYVPVVPREFTTCGLEGNTALVVLAIQNTAQIRNR